MTESPDELWLAFESLAQRYPQDDGVRLTQDLARWLVGERERLKMPVPPELKKLLSLDAAPKTPDPD
jgi:hypothetical protein